MTYSVDTRNYDEVRKIFGRGIAARPMLNSLRDIAYLTQKITGDVSYGDVLAALIKHGYVGPAEIAILKSLTESEAKTYIIAMHRMAELGFPPAKAKALAYAVAKGTISLDELKQSIDYSNNKNIKPKAGSILDKLSKAYDSDPNKTQFQKANIDALFALSRLTSAADIQKDPTYKRYTDPANRESLNKLYAGFREIIEAKISIAKKAGEDAATEKQRIELKSKLNAAKTLVELKRFEAAAKQLGLTDELNQKKTLIANQILDRIQTDPYYGNNLSSEDISLLPLNSSPRQLIVRFQNYTFLVEEGKDGKYFIKTRNPYWQNWSNGIYVRNEKDGLVVRKTGLWDSRVAAATVVAEPQGLDGIGGEEPPTQFWLELAGVSRFEDLDKNKDGYVDRREVAQQIGENFFKAIDNNMRAEGGNGNGQLTRAKFRRAYQIVKWFMEKTGAKLDQAIRLYKNYELIDIDPKELDAAYAQIRGNISGYLGGGILTAANLGGKDGILAKCKYSESVISAVMAQFGQHKGPLAVEAVAAFMIKLALASRYSKADQRNQQLWNIQSPVNERFGAARDVTAANFDKFFRGIDVDEDDDEDGVGSGSTTRLQEKFQKAMKNNKFDEAKRIALKAGAYKDEYLKTLINKYINQSQTGGEISDEMLKKAAELIEKMDPGKDKQYELIKVAPPYLKSSKHAVRLQAIKILEGMPGDSPLSDGEQKSESILTEFQTLLGIPVTRGMKIKTLLAEVKKALTIHTDLHNLEKENFSLPKKEGEEEALIAGVKHDEVTKKLDAIIANQNNTYSYLDIARAHMLKARLLRIKANDDPQLLLKAFEAMAIADRILIRLPSDQQTKELIREANMWMLTRAKKIFNGYLIENKQNKTNDFVKKLAAYIRNDAKVGVDIELPPGDANLARARMQATFGGYKDRMFKTKKQVDPTLPESVKPHLAGGNPTPAPAPGNTNGAVPRPAAPPAAVQGAPTGVAPTVPRPQVTPGVAPPPSKNKAAAAAAARQAAAAGLKAADK
jgi:hypothetical protein